MQNRGKITTSLTVLAAISFTLSLNSCKDESVRGAFGIGDGSEIAATASEESAVTEPHSTEPKEDVSDAPAPEPIQMTPAAEEEAGASDPSPAPSAQVEEPAEETPQSDENAKLEEIWREAKASYASYGHTSLHEEQQTSPAVSYSPETSVSSYTATEEQEMPAPAPVSEVTPSADDLPAGTTPLHRAVMAGKPSLVREALDAPNVNLDARDEMDRTPLMIAAQMDRSTSAEMLLEAGADVDAASTKYGTTVLMMAAMNGYHEVVEVLLQHKASVNQPNKSGYTALMLAYRGGHQKAAEVLLRYGASPDMKDSSGKTAAQYAPKTPAPVVTPVAPSRGVATALHKAVLAGKPSMVKSALSAPGVNVEARDEMDRTPLMVAAQKDRSSSARMLLAAGASPNAVSAKYGTTALMMAAMNGYHEVVEVLIRGGANINAQNKSGFTALMLAARGGHMQTVKVLLNHGASKHIKDSSGRNAAYHAAYREIRQLL